MTQPLKDREIALELARKYAPQLYCEIRSLYDLPCRVLETPQVGEDYTPPLYFQVRDDADHWYVYYMVYHSRDWSDSAIPIVRKLDSHLHDTEAILLRVHKEIGMRTMCTVAHYEWQFAHVRGRTQAVVQYGSHAIYPIGEWLPSGNWISFTQFDFIDLETIPAETWEEWREALKGHASMPDEQYDSRMDDGSYRLRFKPGDIYQRPERVFEFAERRRLCGQTESFHPAF